MKNGLPFDAPWEDHMERDLEMLRASDAICLLPDWVESYGAKIELHLEQANHQGVQQEDSRSKILRNIERSYQMQQRTIKDPSQKHNL